MVVSVDSPVQCSLKLFFWLSWVPEHWVGNFSLVTCFPQLQWDTEPSCHPLSPFGSGAQQLWAACVEFLFLQTTDEEKGNRRLYKRAITAVMTCDCKPTTPANSKGINHHAKILFASVPFLHLCFSCLSHSEYHPSTSTPHLNSFLRRQRQCLESLWQTEVWFQQMPLWGTDDFSRLTYEEWIMGYGEEHGWL